MALTQTLTQLRSAVRRSANAEGAEALARHANADVDDAINRGLAALHRILTRTRGEQRYLASHAISTVANTSAYSLTAVSLQTLITVEGTLDGTKRWFEPFAPEEYAALSDTSAGWEGKPFRYALRGTDIVFLPVPKAVYSITLWYVPHPTTLVNAGDTFDTIARLDDFVVWYAARELATKDGSWELVGVLKAKMDEIRSDIENIARQKDQNGVGRMVDEGLYGRTGRLMYPGRRRA